MHAIFFWYRRNEFLSFALFKLTIPSLILPDNYLLTVFC